VEWKDDSSYIELSKIVSGLSVTNDAAERTVKLGTDYTGVITKDDDRHQDIIQGVELTRRAFPKATRICVMNFMMKEGKQLGDSTDLLMASTEGYDARNKSDS
jgi:hypothetical protein